MHNSDFTPCVLLDYNLIQAFESLITRLSAKEILNFLSFLKKYGFYPSTSGLLGHGRHYYHTKDFENFEISDEILKINKLIHLKQTCRTSSLNTWRFCCRFGYYSKSGVNFVEIDDYEMYFDGKTNKCMKKRNTIRMNCWMFFNRFIEEKHKIKFNADLMKVCVEYI